MTSKKNIYELKYYGSKKKYYQNKISFMDLFFSVRYIQFLGNSKYTKFMKEIPYYTKHIDLTLNPDELKQSFSKRVRAKINKATKTGVEFQIYKLDNDKQINNYVKYCNDHIKSKKLLYKLTKRDITSFLDNYVVTHAIYNNETLVMHGYFVDYESKTVYANESASQFRTLDNSSEVNRDFISRANNFLHYQDMLYFKEQGMKIYDFGGYTVDSTDKSMLNINRFKDGFRGELIQQNHYESYIFFTINSLYQQIKPCIVKMRISKIKSFGNTLRLLTPITFHLNNNRLFGVKSSDG